MSQSAFVTGSTMKAKASATVCFLVLFPIATTGFAKVHAEIARPCEDDTKHTDKLLIADALAPSPASTICIDASTRMVVETSAIAVHKNRFGMYSVDMLLTSEAADRWKEWQRTSLHQHFVVFNPLRSIGFSIRVTGAQQDGKLTVFAASQEQAEFIGSLLQGD